MYAKKVKSLCPSITADAGETRKSSKSSVIGLELNMK